MSAATINEFWATKPADQAWYTTLEVYNANAGLRRFVAGQQSAQTFTLEANAPRNAGESVSFEPVGFRAPQPEQGDDGMTLDIQLGAIGFEAKPYIKDVIGSWPPTIEIVWRQHLSGVTDPVQWFYFEAADLSLESISVGIRAEQVNQAARDVSRIYKGDEFQGLRGSI